MKNIKIHFVNPDVMKHNVDLDAYKAAIKSAFDGYYAFEFVIDAFNHPDTAWEEHGGVSVISGFTSDAEFSEIRNKLLEIYQALSEAELKRL